MKNLSDKDILKLVKDIKDACNSVQVSGISSGCSDGNRSTRRAANTALLFN